ncbi:MAG TPA: hypothetical protein VIX63_17120 [Vicinamibacterales bacterium]
MCHRLRITCCSCTAILLIALAPSPLRGQAPNPQTTTPGPQPAGQAAGAASAPAPAPAVMALTDTGWPRDVTTGQTTITIYQPQFDSWDGFHLTARSAVAVTEKPGAPAVYGIVQVSADAHIDKDDRIVSLEKITVTSAAFPSVDGEKARQWATALQARATRMRPLALERFEAALAVMAAERKGESVPVRNDPPIIHISTVPALLILIDGEPAYRDVKGTSLTRVLNSRPLILKDATKHYLKIFDGWMEAPALTGPWTVAAKVPADCDRALRAAADEKVVDMLIGGNPDDPKTAPSLKNNKPQIYVDTKPAELLVLEGDPKFVPLAGTRLMYAENTTGNLFVHAEDQRAYVLVSGRWFRGPSALEGPWEFVAADSLPKDFSAIPDESPKENVKASIAGTGQAEEAIIANSVPQTAQVKRSDARFAPAFDGAPKLAPIESTKLEYVVNASQPVIAVGTPVEYFGVQNGVWFVSSSLNGPWLVASKVPADIYAIPASSPLHYVTYVRIYDSTPEYVIVGYTPGYTGAYVVNGCVVYGTGYYYPPWIGSYWYGPPYTYGFGVSMAYTPWAGWHMGFGFGWTWGTTVAIGWGWGAYPWWGGYGWGPYYPYVYRPGGVAWGPRGGMAAWGPGYWSGTTGNMYHRWGSTTAVTRRTGGYNAWTGNRWAGQAGRAYNSRTGVAAAGQRGVVGNVYSGNYAAGSRGAAVNTRTGAAVAGRAGTAGNIYTGNEVKGAQGVVRGPGGETTRVGAIAGEDGGALRVGDDVYAGRDGNVYKRNEGGGWDTVTRPQPRDGAQTGAINRGQLDREHAGRTAGNYRSGAARSGGYHGGVSRAGGARGGRRR